jgi:hypothetical protein
MPIKQREAIKMKTVRALTTMKVIVLLVVITFLSSSPGMVFGEEVISGAYEEMIAGLGDDESPGIVSGDMIGINQETCNAGPLLCFGCYEYICIGLYGYATMTSESCFLLAFCFSWTDCQALCFGLVPDGPAFQ